MATGFYSESLQGEGRKSAPGGEWAKQFVASATRIKTSAVIGYSRFHAP
uniref:Uncharacterized protein n=1 Tax=Enterobacter cloacae TaxID=550 RepID=A0A2L1KM95_ENTCL|nr:hypothetical protein [Citrobacter freundii]AVE23628.1 hypothetical protein [Enterobacter cloacae]QIM11160.1 hypothetical protein [Leclercia sp.]